MSRRTRAIGVMAGVVVLVAAGAVAVPRLVAGCGEQVAGVAATGSESPFLDAADRRAQPDRDRDALVAALESAPAPFGEVQGAVGYHYEQWAQVSAFTQGIGVRTRDNPDFTMLDDRTLKPRWSVRVDSKRSAYDASDERYLVATMPAGRAPDLVVLDAENGNRIWCSSLDGPQVQAGDPFATQMLDGGDVAALTPGTDNDERLLRLDGSDGSTGWERDLDVGSGDFLGALGEDRLIAGGREQFRLFDDADLAKRPAGPALVALSAKDGRVLWTRDAPAGTDVHVLGTDPGTATAVVLERSTSPTSTRLVALDAEGEQTWAVVPAGGDSFDATLRAGRVLIRAGNRWSAYALVDGRLLWSRLLPERPQFLPYGFELGSIPLLDADHALIGGTTGLHTLDLRTGAMASAALPTDGINTTYWPYQLAVSPGLIAVATNTGAVVLRRE